MDRPTTEIILPISGAKVILYEFLTTFQDREIKKIALKTVSFNNETGSVNSNVTGEFLSEAEDLALGFLIKEIQPVGAEPITDGFVDYIGGLHKEDGDVVYTKVNKITSGSKLSPEDKKK